MSIWQKNTRADRRALSVIRIVPPEEVLDEWEADYLQMCNSFIYGNKLPFNDLLNRIAELQARFRKVKTVLDL